MVKENIAMYTTFFKKTNLAPPKFSTKKVIKTLEKMPGEGDYPFPLTNSPAPTDLASGWKKADYVNIFLRQNNKSGCMVHTSI